jgi:hypothetical protein
MCCSCNKKTAVDLHTKPTSAVANLRSKACEDDFYLLSASSFPMVDSGILSAAAMPVTSSRGRAWDPYIPMTPAREPGWNDEPLSYHSAPSTCGSATALYAPYSPIGLPAPSPSNGNVRHAQVALSLFTIFQR